MNLNESFEIHDTLNPKLWDMETGKLLPEVREKIVEIVAAFERNINVPIDIVDIHLVGSNASFNWTENSDLDVHVIANFDTVSDDRDLITSLYNAKKAAFNKELNISIHDVPIELYVEDIRSNVASNGIYSVCDNEWVKEPKPLTSAKKHNVEKELEKWKVKVAEVLDRGKYEEINNTINSIYLMRKNSIAIDGEGGKGNQLFKEIRSAGLLGELKDALSASLSRKLSLESIRGRFVNRYDD